jgi:hypothetical protein
MKTEIVKILDKYRLAFKGIGNSQYVIYSLGYEKGVYLSPPLNFDQIKIWLEGYQAGKGDITYQIA